MSSAIGYGGDWNRWIVGDRFAVEWSPVAVRDLDLILDYVWLRDRREAADRLAEKILGAVEALSHSPVRCRVVPELATIGIRDLREKIVGPYRAVFLLRERTVSIVALLDGRRNLAELLVERATRELP